MLTRPSEFAPPKLPPSPQATYRWSSGPHVTGHKSLLGAAVWCVNPMPGDVLNDGAAWIR